MNSLDVLDDASLYQVCARMNWNDLYNFTKAHPLHAFVCSELVERKLRATVLALITLVALANNTPQEELYIELDGGKENLRLSAKGKWPRDPAIIARGPYGPLDSFHIIYKSDLNDYALKLQTMFENKVKQLLAPGFEVTLEIGEHNTIQDGLTLDAIKTYHNWKEVIADLTSILSKHTLNVRYSFTIDELEELANTIESYLII